MKVLVTGANGFIGSALIKHLLFSTNYSPVAAIRNFSFRNSIDVPVVRVGDLSSKVDWTEALKDIDIVVHTAARVHVMKDEVTDPLHEFRKVNVVGTLSLAKQAAALGVRRFVYLSSVKVNGEFSEIDTPFTAKDDPRPKDAYGISKMEGEQGLSQISSETGMGLVVIRPPLVYGPYVGANFLRLINLIHRKVPLPFASIDNRRSLVGLGNLVDAICECLVHPNAEGKTYLISDNDDVSTPELVKRIADSFGCSDNLFPFPPNLMRWFAKIGSKNQEIGRLLDSLVIDSSPIREELNWEPPKSMHDELDGVADWYSKNIPQPN